MKPVLLYSSAASSCFEKSACDDNGTGANQNNYNGGNNDGNGQEKLRLSLVALGCLYTAVLYWRSKRVSDSTQNYTAWGSSWKIPQMFIQSANCAEEPEKPRSKSFNFLAEAVEMAAPSVVYIERTHVLDTVFRQVVAQSSGSGFIVDEDGYVMTNAHVVRNARTVNVRLSDGRDIKGTVTNSDEVTDLALIKLQLKIGEKLPVAPFGSSKSLRPGEWVIALGSPLSLSNTITAGIVSCVHRPSAEMGLSFEKPDMEYIQTDAPITIGNSGGPLVNLDGEVIGINTMTAGPGISFAIPSDIAKEFLNSTKTSKKKPAKKYGLGVSMLTITPNVLYSLRSRRQITSSVTQGVLLVQIWPGSPADSAGLRNDDIVVKINGREVKSSKEVYKMVQQGRPMDLEIVRSGQKMLITVTPEPVEF